MWRKILLRTASEVKESRGARRFSIFTGDSLQYGAVARPPPSCVPGSLQGRCCSGRGDPEFTERRERAFENRKAERAYAQLVLPYPCRLDSMQGAIGQAHNLGATAAPTHRSRATVLSPQTHLFLKEMRKTKTLEEKKKMLIERQAGGALSSTAPHAPLLSFAPHNRLWLRLSLRAAAAAPLRTIALSSLLRQAKMKAMPPDERKKMTSETKARAGLSLPSHVGQPPGCARTRRHADAARPSSCRLPSKPCMPLTAARRAPHREEITRSASTRC